MTNEPTSDSLRRSRRLFLQRMAGAAGTVALGPLAGCQSINAGATPSMVGSTTTSATRAAANASSAPQASGPRSLVHVMLHGGADSLNMFVPLDHAVAGQDYASYAKTRGTLAVPKNDLLGFGNGDFGLHPDLPGLAALGERNQLAVVSNVGPLAQPITRTDLADLGSVPQSLFAHDAQQKLWQTARQRLHVDLGWGGSILDSLSSGSELSPAFSIAGANHWLATPVIGYSQLSPTTSIDLMRGYDASLESWIPTRQGLEAVMLQALDLADHSDSPFERAAADRLRTAKLMTEQLLDVTADDGSNEVGMEGIDGNRLGLQLRRVAQLIKNREALGLERQLFFVHMGGWDTHSEQAERFPALLRELDGALSSFTTAIDNMGLGETVTTFTTSDFGRTLTSNGDGTDHGWGGNTFVIGGAVDGGRYGTAPSLSASKNPDDAGDGRGGFAGRLIPTTSVSQYGATLAGWMGLDQPGIEAAFPELANFAVPNLGFMRP